MSGWAFYLAEVTTGRVVTELVVDSPNLQRHTRGGTGSAKINMDAISATRRAELIEATTPWKYSLIAEHNDQIAGEWFIQRRTRAAESPSRLAIQGGEPLSYLTRRLVGAWNFPASTDQLTLAWTLIADAFNGAPGTGVGAVAVNLGVPPTCGVTRARKYNRYEQKASDAVTDLSDLSDGFEVTIESSWSTTSNVRQVNRKLRFGYPMLGADTQLIIDLSGPGSRGGDARSLIVEDDGNQLASQIIALGAGEGSARKIGVATNSRLTAAGFPFLQTGVPLTVMSQQALVNAYASAQLAYSNSAELPPTLTIEAGGDPSFEDYTIGDRIRLNVDPQPVFPLGYRKTVRILGWTVSPASTGTDTVDLELTSNIVAPKE